MKKVAKRNMRSIHFTVASPRGIEVPTARCLEATVPSVSLAVPDAHRCGSGTGCRDQRAYATFASRGIGRKSFRAVYTKSALVYYRAARDGFLMRWLCSHGSST